MNRYARFIAMALAALMLLVFVGCEKDKDPPVKEEQENKDKQQTGKDGDEKKDKDKEEEKQKQDSVYAFELKQSEIPLAPKAVGEVAITKGNGEYEVSSSDEKVATAAIKDDKTAVVITAKDIKKEQTATITVKDKKANKELTIKVKVSPTGPVEPMKIKELSTGKLTLNPGTKSPEYQITGGKAPFSVKSNSNKEVATAEIIKESKLVITATKKEGVDTIVLRDAGTDSISIAVKVKKVKDITLKESKVSVEVGKMVEVEITDGNGGYKVTEFTKPALASVTIKDSKVVITAGADAGSGTVKIEDAEGKTATITVTVEKLAEIAVEKSVEIEIGKSKTLDITSGNGGYKLSGFNEKIATAEVKDDNKVIITAIGIGKTTITVTDKKGKEAEIKVTVTAEKVFEIKVQESVVLEVGKSETLNIKSGNGGYTLSVKDANIATAELMGKDKNEIKITAKGKGETIITVTDKKGKKAEIKVKATEEKLADIKVEKNVELKVGGSETLSITSGNGGYKLSDFDKTIATATLKGENKIEIKAVGKGETTITVKDKKGKTAEIKVTVTEEKVFEIKVESTSANLKVGGSETLSITSGNGDYKVSSDDTSVATVTLKGEDKIEIKAVKKGETTITVKDKKGKTATITVTVKEEQVVEITVEKSSVSMKVGEKKMLSITSGNGGYTASSSDPNVAAAEVQNGNMVEITAVSKGGPVTITVKDKKGKTAKITVTVTEAIKPLTINDKQSLTVNYKLGTAEVPEVMVKGGKPPYAAKSDNEQVATRTMVGSDGKLSWMLTGKPGTATITVTGGSETVTLTLMVQDSDPIVPEKTEVTYNDRMGGQIGFTGGVEPFELKVSTAGIVTKPRPFRDRMFDISPMKSGTTELTIIDKYGKQSSPIRVTVQLPLMVKYKKTAEQYIDQEISLDKGKENKELMIEDGVGEISVASAAPNIASANIANGSLVIKGLEAGSTTLTIKDEKTRVEVRVKVKATVAIVSGETQCFIVKGDYVEPNGTKEEIIAHSKKEMADKKAIIMPKAAKKIKMMDFPGWGTELAHMLTVDLNNIEEIESKESTMEPGKFEGALNLFNMTTTWIFRKVSKVGPFTFSSFNPKFVLKLEMDKSAIEKMEFAQNWIENGAIIKCRNQECIEAIKSILQDKDNFDKLEFKLMD